MSEELNTDATTVASSTPATSAETPVASPEHPQKSELVAIAIGVAGWFVPGLGHGLQKMWGRAVGCFLTVAALVILGVGLRGEKISSEGGDASECWDTSPISGLALFISPRERLKQMAQTSRTP